MIQNQFFFTRKEPVAPKRDTNDISSVSPPLEFREFRDSINVDKIILSMTQEDGTLLVFMDDYHELIDTVPVTNKQGKQTSFKKEHVTVQSNVTIVSPEDIEKFYTLTSIK